MAIAPIQHVVIIGGTHGNELTGIYLVKKFQRFPEQITRSSFRTTTILANPKAIAHNRRYMDRDLNRCFSAQDLENTSLTTYEDQRAKAIASQLNPTQGLPADFIIDIHSTTSNMGITLLLSSDHPFNLHLAAYLSQMNPKVKVCFREPPSPNTPMLRSLSPLGFTLEVGPISHGTLSPHLFQQTESLIGTILNYLESWNSDKLTTQIDSVTIFQAFETLDYPRDAKGDIQAMVHPNLQGRDYGALHPEAELFLGFDHTTLNFKGIETVYPIFINEAAYYEKQIAMVLTHKCTAPLHPMPL